MHMHRDDRGGAYETDNIVNTYEPERVLGWATTYPDQEPLGYRYTYLLEPDGDDRTIVTQVYDWSGVTDARLLQLFPRVTAADCPPRWTGWRRPSADQLRNGLDARRRPDGRPVLAPLSSADVHASRSSAGTVSDEPSAGSRALSDLEGDGTRLVPGWARRRRQPGRPRPRRDR